MEIVRKVTTSPNLAIIRHACISYYLLIDLRAIVILVSNSRVIDTILTMNFPWKYSVLT